MHPRGGVWSSECLIQHKPTEEDEREEEPSWQENPLDGVYHQNIEEEADSEKSSQWAGGKNH